ncbi:MAG: CIA30 family protein [Phycisphaerales bacterium]|nr:CIA30 family protein [Phycisphaerales bacterium]
MIHYLIVASVLLVLPYAQAHSDQSDQRSQDLALVEMLVRSIQRGVPLFNAGQHEACASIYQTAVDALLLGSGWGLSVDERNKLKSGAVSSAAVEDPVTRAWAYRELIDAILEPRRAFIAAIDFPDKILFSFNTEADQSRWRVVLDGVMGGRSTGSIDIEDGKLIFTGETSLANNGGFSSIRGPVDVGAMQGLDTLRIRVKGDGRTYIVGTRKRSGLGGDSYWHRFDTVADQWMTIDVPLQVMQRHYFGQRMPGMIQSSDVRGIEFYIYDKKAGPFRLEVDAIEAVAGRI